MDLSAVTPRHFNLLYVLAATEPHRWLRLCRERVPAPAEFESYLWADVYAQFVVMEGERFVGTAGLHNASERNRTVWAEVVLTSQEWAEEREIVFDLVADHAFERGGFRKVYAQYPSYEQTLVGGASRYSWTEEARLNEHILHETFYWDQVLVSTQKKGPEEELT